MPSGRNGSSLSSALAHAGEADRRAGDFLDGERRAAARVAVELGEHDAGEAEALVERRRGLHRVLTDHRVDHEEDVLRLGARALIVASSCISASSIARRPAVS